MEAYAESDEPQGRIIDLVPMREDASILEVAEAINADWRSTAASILRAAQTLAHAQQNWESVRYELLLSKLCFGRRTVSRLLSIGKSQAWAIGTHVSQLPAHWSTLAQLARLSPPQMQCALDEDWIHPDLERKDVPRLIERVNAKLGIKVERKTLRPKLVPFHRELMRRLGKGVVAWVDGLDERTRAEFIKRIADVVLREKQAADGEVG